MNQAASFQHFDKTVRFRSSYSKARCPEIVINKSCKSDKTPIKERFVCEANSILNVYQTSPLKNKIVQKLLRLDAKPRKLIDRITTTETSRTRSLKHSFDMPHKKCLSSSSPPTLTSVKLKAASRHILYKNGVSALY